MIDIRIWTYDTFKTSSFWTKKTKLILPWNTSEYHVSCTDGKISVRIIYFYYQFFHRRPFQCFVFFPRRPFIVTATCWSCRVNDERPTGNKTQLVSGTTVEEMVIKINNSNWNLPISAWNTIFKNIDAQWSVELNKSCCNSGLTQNL